MKLLATMIMTSMMLFGCATSNQLAPLSQMPPSVVSEGSLANEKLIVDTTAALINSGYVQPNAKILKLIMQQPEGRAGQKVWREIWIVNPEDNPARFVITFTQDGLNAADFAIQKM